MPNDAQPPATGNENAAPSGLGAAAKFNPQLWKPDELRAIFVVRQAELADLTRRVTQAPTDHAPQHVLITGHRGMGKSTLLHRLALEVEDRDALRRAWVPLLFREEQYTAVSLDKFWRNAIDALCEALERRAATNPQLRVQIAELDAKNAAIDALPDAEKREAQAIATLTEFAERYRTRFLLLVDSTEQLFDAIAADKTAGEASLWRLRELLSHDPRFFWVSCAYTALEARQTHEAPFHEFFAQLPLKALGTDELRQAFKALAATFGAGRGLPPEQAQAHVQQLLTQQPERLEALLRLAGGNPRTTVMLYQLLAAGGHDNVHNDLQRLLDDLSPLYKDRLEHQLTTQTRQVVATLMEYWAPMSANALALATHLKVTLVNAQLSRLIAEGWVQKVPLAGTKRHGYQVAERLFNVWYLMRLAPRRARQRLSWLVEFMRLWFSDQERSHLAQERSSRHKAGAWCDPGHMDYSLALTMSLNEGSQERAALELSLFKRTVRGKLGDILLFDLDGEDQSFGSLEDYQARFAKLRPLLEQPMPLENASDAERKAFADAVLGSPVLSLRHKEQIARTFTTWSQSELDELTKFLAVGSEFVSFLAFRDDVEPLVSCVRSGDIFFDLPEVEGAMRQIDAAFDHASSAYLLAICLLLVKHPTAADLAASRVIACINRKLLSARVSELLLDLISENSNAATAEELYAVYIRLAPENAMLRKRCGDLLQDRFSRFEEAGTAYRQAIALNPKDASSHAKLGRILARTGREAEAREAYRNVLALLKAKPEQRNSSPYLALQAHLFLGGLPDAENALSDLCEPLGKDSNDVSTLFRINKQVRECLALGLGLALADLMAKNPHAQLLKPIELALRTSSGQADALLEHPAELQALAQEIAKGWIPK